MGEHGLALAQEHVDYEHFAHLSPFRYFGCLPAIDTLDTSERISMTDLLHKHDCIYSDDAFDSIGFLVSGGSLAMYVNRRGWPI